MVVLRLCNYVLPGADFIAFKTNTIWEQVLFQNSSHCSRNTRDYWFTNLHFAFTHFHVERSRLDIQKFVNSACKNFRNTLKNDLLSTISMYVFWNSERNADDYVKRRSKYGALKRPPQSVCNAVHVRHCSRRVEETLWHVVYRMRGKASQWW